MKFLCVGYYDQKKMDALPKAQIDAVMSECPPFMDQFYDSGKVFLVAGTAGEKWNMQRVGGAVQTTDIPRHAAKEAIGCVFFVEAADIAEAMRVAALHPTTRLAAGEQLGFRIGIAPVHYFEQRGLKDPL